MPIANHGPIRAEALAAGDTIIVGAEVVTVTDVTRTGTGEVELLFDVLEVPHDAGDIDGEWPVIKRAAGWTCAAGDTFALLQSKVFH